jgi:hypothetical protein
MDYEVAELGYGGFCDVLALPLPEHVSEVDRNAIQKQLADYVDESAMVLEGWDTRDAQWLGEYRWGWVDYNLQLAYLCLEVTGYPDFRLFFWINDFAFAGSRAIYPLAVNHNSEVYLFDEGIAVLRRRRDDVIAQLSGPEP